MPLTSTDLTMELGSSGLDRHDIWVSDEKLRQLSDPRRRNRLFREMGDNDSIAGAVLFALDMLIRQVNWDVQSPTGDESAQLPPVYEEATRFVDSCLKDLQRPFKDIISEMLSFLQFGWYAGEKVFKQRRGMQPPAKVSRDQAGQIVIEPSDLPSSRFDDGKLGWHKIAGRAQDTLYGWIFDPHGEVLGLIQQAPPDWKLVTIPITKLVHLRTTARGNNPEGQSVFRRGYRSWYFKKTLEELMAIGVERDLAGLAVLRVPKELLRPKSDLTAPELSLREGLERMLRNVRRGAQEGVMLPSERDAEGGYEYDFALLGQGGRRQFNLKELLEYFDQRIALMALADVILLGHEKVGSFALASSKTEMLSTAIGAWLDMIADEFNRKHIPELLELNGFPVDFTPQLVHSDVESLDLGVLGEYVSKLASSGMTLFPTPDGELERALLEEAGLPVPDTDL